MTYNPYDFDHEKSRWFLGDTAVESKVGDWMRANISLEHDELPYHMAELLRRLRDRETPSASHSRAGASDRTTP